MNRALYTKVSSIRHRLSIVYIKIVAEYFPALTRCGNTCFVSIYRRMHCKKRHMGGNVEKNPRTRECPELHCVIALGDQLFAYRQKKSGTFANEYISELY